MKGSALYQEEKSDSYYWRWGVNTKMSLHKQMLLLLKQPFSSISSPIFSKPTLRAPFYRLLNLWPSSLKRYFIYIYISPSLTISLSFTSFLWAHTHVNVNKKCVPFLLLIRLVSLISSSPLLNIQCKGKVVPSWQGHTMKYTVKREDWVSWAGLLLTGGGGRDLEQPQQSSTVLQVPTRTYGHDECSESGRGEQTSIGAIEASAACRKSTHG